jgi:hypothetical protein
MKKIILGCILFMSLGSIAQTQSSEHKNGQEDQNKKKGPCAFTMTNGKMMMVVNGKTVVMDKETTTKNGTIVQTDGTVKTKDKTVKMKNGDCMDMSGKIIWVKNEQINENNNQNNNQKTKD